MSDLERHRRRAAQALGVAFAAAVLGLIAGWTVATLQGDRANRAETNEAEAVQETGDTRAATRDILTELLDRCDSGPTAPQAVALCARAEGTVEAIDNGDPITVTGPTGPAGADGDNGADGEDGARGVQGQQGATGSRGPVGPPGDTGPAGADGTNGTDGATGPPGPTGPTGAAGPAGAVGPVGPQGPQGDAGPAGAPCPDGFTLTATTLLTDEGPVDAFVCRAA